MQFDITGHVVDEITGAPVAGAQVTISRRDKDKDNKYKDKDTAWHTCHTCHTDQNGGFHYPVSDHEDANYRVTANAFRVPSGSVLASPDCTDLIVRLRLSSEEPFKFYVFPASVSPQNVSSPIAGSRYEIELPLAQPVKNEVDHVNWTADGADISPLSDQNPLAASFSAYASCETTVRALIHSKPATGASEGEGIASFSLSGMLRIEPAPVIPLSRVSLQRSAVRPTREENLWTLIRANTRAIGFNEYREFINRVLRHSKEREISDHYPTFLKDKDSQRFQRERGELVSTFGVGVYELLRTATELFLLLNCRAKTSRRLDGEELLEERERRVLPLNTGDLKNLAQSYLGNNAYIHHVIDAAFPGDREHHGTAFSDGVLLRTEPCLIELIWSYWHEEAMLTQSLQAIARRFQNHRARGLRDPLAHFELDPLRPLNNILWGYVQEEFRRLTVPRRALEYSHEYGLTLYGKANPGTRSADPRSKFLESFHNLLHRCSQFFKEDNDTTVIADGFPLLNALREVHLVLAQGAHNQFGDLPWTARVEMLIEQWIMARSETRDFLQSRAMVPYTEAWMPQVDTMKMLQGWTDVSVSHFHDLARYGEEILLSIRYGDWVHLHDEDVAKNWARYWRAEIQSYLHAYRAAVGVDLTSSDTVDATIPGIHLQRRLEAQARVR